MPRTAVLDDIVPARHARAYEIKKGQVLRIYLVEDTQVGDVVFYNAHDYREWFHVGQSWVLNNDLGNGDGKFFHYFYSKPPRENLMLTVVEDTVKNHFCNLAARCSRRSLELRGRGSEDRSCQESLEEALEPFGLSGDDIGDIFNIFLNAEVDENGKFDYVASAARKDDYVDLRADMDLLTAVSACPSPTVVNGYEPKPLGIKIFG